MGPEKVIILELIPIYIYSYILYIVPTKLQNIMNLKQTTRSRRTR